MSGKPIERKVIGERLRELRLERGLTQVEAAERLGTDQPLISRYERGLPMSLEMLAQLADAYDTTLDYIVRGRRSAA